MLDNATAYIGLGSNLSDPIQQIKQAVQSLEELEGSSLRRCSHLYGSKPMGPADQPDYVNAVVEIVTTLTPRSLLAALQKIEQRQGRERNGLRWGPRTLDLDLLIYADYEIDETDLKVPHPGIKERNFVLYPLRDIVDENFKIPGLGLLTEIIKKCSSDELELIE